MAEARKPAVASYALPDAGAALLLSPVRRGIVEELTRVDPQERRTGLSAAELGARLDLHATTIRFHVDQLVTAGILDAHFVRDGGVGRPSKKYILHEVPLGDHAQADEGPFALLAGLLTSVLSTEEAGRLTPEEAGVRWATERAAALREAHGEGAARRDGNGEGAVRRDSNGDGAGESTRQGQIDKARDVTHLLRDWGYSPEVEDGEEAGEVGLTLHDCPFLPLAASNPDVVCGVHRGLLRGALDAVGETGARVSLRPFTGPTTCRAMLQLDPPGTPGPETTDTTSEPPIKGDHR